MSEYWVSKKKYFCKYCEIYITDDAPSRQHHENGLRHKGNTEKFIRGLYKAGEKRQKDLEEEKRDIARVEQAAQAAFAQDVGAGLAKPIKAVASTSIVTRKPLPKPSNPYSNYSTAESLGYKDPDAERLALEADHRRTQGVAGDWQIIAPPPPPPTTTTTLDVSDPEAADGIHKRGADVSVSEEDNRQFKLRKKTLGSGLGEIFDPGFIPVKPKKKEEPVTGPLGVSGDVSKPADALKWTKVQWKKGGENVTQEGETSASPRDGRGRGQQVAVAVGAEDKQSKNEEIESVSITDQKDIQMKLEESGFTLPVPEPGESLFRKQDASKPTEAPKWTKVQWKGGENVRQEGETSASSLDGRGMGEQVAVAVGAEDEQLKNEEKESVSITPGPQDQKDIQAKLEESGFAFPVPEPGESLFRKRKLHPSASRGKRV